MSTTYNSISTTDKYPYTNTLENNNYINFDNSFEPQISLPFNTTPLNCLSPEGINLNSMDSFYNQDNNNMEINNINGDINNQRTRPNFKLLSVDSPHSPFLPSFSDYDYNHPRSTLPLSTPNINAFSPLGVFAPSNHNDLYPMVNTNSMQPLINNSQVDYSRLFYNQQLLMDAQNNLMIPPRIIPQLSQYLPTGQPHPNAIKQYSMYNTTTAPQIKPEPVEYDSLFNPIDVPQTKREVGEDSIKALLEPSKRTRQRGNTLVKTIPCSFPGCKKMFSRHYNMKTHLEIHESVRVKSFKCPSCDRAFSRKHDMSRHFRTIHARQSRRNSTTQS